MAKSVKRFRANVKIGAKGKVILPLLNVLRSIKPEQRQILLAHFDDSTRDLIYNTISEVLKSERIPLRQRLSLKTKLDPFKSDLRYLTHPRKGKSGKKKRLNQIGGGPMNHILKAAIPLLLNIFPQ